MTDEADGFCSSGRDVSCPLLCSVNFMLVFVDISPKFFKQISQIPSMFQRYLTILWVSSQSFPAGRTKFLEFTDWSCRPRFPCVQISVHTVKILKIGTPEIITIIVLQLEQLDFTVQYCVQKMQTE